MARDGERGRGDWKARRGSRDSGPYAEGNGGDTGPVDIAAVRRDDALIDAISSDGPVQTDSEQEYQLATLLADWRSELIAPPLPSSPDLDEVVAAVNQEIGARKVRVGAQAGGHLRLVRPILGTAAALALVFGGVTAFSYNAEPGNPLWKVKEVVFSEQALTTVVNRADGQMGEAQQALQQSNPTQAAAQLGRAKENLAQVSDQDKKTELEAEWKKLVEELRGSSPEGRALAAQLDPVTDITTLPGASVTTAPTRPGDVTTKPTDPGSSAAVTVPPVTQEPPVTTVPPVTTPPPVTVDPSTVPTVPSTVIPTTIAPPPSAVTPTAGGDVTIPTQPSLPSIPGTTATFQIPSMPNLPGPSS
ncbi:anti-sigma-D factor RsdA [Nocardia sp. XZ_19_385]|uniref:anti-sigma-D factor RsdA n=1 Tax=Nocardia sp. XZ_19_385 TaxID=2769488 RepID=UPI001890456A|nr:anti-sigma-D factor RsdA [Nocardia sp. XZ_19_385]